MKKEWTKPKLISLYRGRPEEAVLLVCKLVEDGGTGPDIEVGYRGCDNLQGPDGFCSAEGLS